ncbi:NRDE family protein [Parasphingorhabdus sp. JC815]|uniref:NRDE family protein n=1 Tax=Parasphingorhabdus sp. JC815 TaxID=3232140 RepID=UPI00345AC830
MCILAFAWQAHPRWPLVAMANRDEIHTRPAEALARWDDPSHLLAGRDTKAGGTWLGISEEGRFAAITNLSGHGAADIERASRGDLLKDYLSGHGRFAELSTTRFSEFNPFNLITVDRNQAFIHSNRPDTVSDVLAPGIHSLSNGPLNNPWPKAAHLNSVLEHWIDQRVDDPETLLEPLLDRKNFPTAAQINGGAEYSLEPRNSGIFIQNPVYGTRCSTVVAIDDKGTGTIIERRFAASGETTGETRLAFTWPI